MNRWLTFNTYFKRGETWIIFALLFSMGISAFGIVYCRDMHRQLYSQLQVLMTESDKLHVEWSRLLLEESTWATHSRIQRKAQSELQMIQPKQPMLLKVK